MTDKGDQGAGTADLAALARGGRINFFGFILRLLARLGPRTRIAVQT